MSSNSGSSNSGIGVVGLLGIVFVVLKLVGTIDWSWWLVTLPFWGGISLFVVGVGIYLGFMFILELLRRK